MSLFYGAFFLKTGHAWCFDCRKAMAQASGILGFKTMDKKPEDG